MNVTEKYNNFSNKLNELDSLLKTQNSGKQINGQLEIVNKETGISRLIKIIFFPFFFILGKDLFASTRIQNVAKKIFEECNEHKDHLKVEEKNLALETIGNLTQKSKSQKAIAAAHLWKQQIEALAIDIPSPPPAPPIYQPKPYQGQKNPVSRPSGQANPSPKVYMNELTSAINKSSKRRNPGTFTQFEKPITQPRQPVKGRREKKK